MGWLSKLLKGSSSAAAAAASSSSSLSSSSSWSAAKGKYGCSYDSDDQNDEYLNHHSYEQDHGEAGEDNNELAAHIGGLSLEYSPTYNYNNNYSIGTNVFQPYTTSSDHSWPDAFWQTEDSARIQTYTELEASQYDNSPRKYFDYNNQHLICDVCQQQNPVDSVEEDDIWKLKYCVKHYDDGSKRCHSCRRFEAMGTKYSSRGDGRYYCGDCNASAIMNMDECGPLIQQIYQFYQDLDMTIYQFDIQIEMIDRKEMKRRGHSSHTNGLTSRKEHSSLYTNITTPSFGPDNTIIGTKKQPFKLVSYKEVRYILLLNGCPRLYTGHTLAHEIMHAWLHLGGFVGSNTPEGFVGKAETKQIREGLCQVMALKWLESQVKSSKHQFDTKLAQHLMRDIKERGDELYGDGFRLVNPSVVSYGLKGTLDYIRMTGKFPLY